ncbi:hypothetical protein CMV_019540 [Castanea mollissima]|uniref:Uncharacterized protein n=1 Tax=Castanea mollissima TaxID=60419 RepID=A0A8J4QJL1_9ROSI|nr:hypothetical protein CMV_019540 [Castanea mollissima]
MDHTQKPVSLSTHESWHRSILNSLSSSPGDDQELLLYSYNHVMHGFSARLTPSQLSEVEKSPAHLATYPESFGKLLTTYSPKFLGLQQNVGIWPAASYGEDVIVGIFDTGIWPESESFNDEGMSPVPQRWKGKCENSTTFSPSYCNRKLIGAQSFSKGLQAAGINISNEPFFNSARDYMGHGTHTASTAVGNYVHDVSHFGYARGTARGVAPRAHLAVYKVLWATSTRESASTDVLAGMDQAIEDGVDIMSLSIGINQTSYFTDSIAKGSLSAIEKGIFVVCGSGNDGDFKTIYNGAPWITTVGAGTIDRSFHGKVTLGNGVTIEGTSYFPESGFITNLPLYYGTRNMSKAICNHKALDKGGYWEDASFSFSPNEYSIPSLIVPTASGTRVKEYVTKVRNPIVNDMRFLLTRFGTKPAPQIAKFSSRGPSTISPGVLKPDILAPGVDVLAAFSPISPYIRVGKYDLASNYVFLSGTSMSTPHVAGVGALLKAIHPEWSPAAIRSAMMTTAYVKDNTGNIFKSQLTNSSSSPLDFGAGHINPNKAMDPGLIYDMGLQDYIQFVCGLGYTKKQMILLLRRTRWSCDHKSIHDLNYPTFIGVLSNETRYPVTMKFNRVVTNVGNDKSVYRAHLENIPTGMRVSVKPRILTFTRKHQNRSFVASVVLDKLDGENPIPTVFGFLKWIDQDSHIVSSPIVAIKY